MRHAGEGEFAGLEALYPHLSVSTSASTTRARVTTHDGDDSHAPEGDEKRRAAPG